MEEHGKSLIETTSDEIVNYIKNHNLESGDKLPNEFQLAEILDVGRSTLREAVRSLVSRNILEVRQGSGTYVSENLGVMEDPLGFTFVKDTLKLTEDLFELRFLLEPKVASLAAENATADQIEELEKLRDEIELAIQSSDKFHFEKDKEFHKLIAEMSGNLAMSNIVPVINQSISLYNEYYTSDRIVEETILSHREIVDAIKHGLPNLAHDAMVIHISNNRRSLAQNKLERARKSARVKKANSRFKKSM